MLFCPIPLIQWHLHVLILRHCMPRPFVHISWHFRAHNKGEALQSTLLWILSLSFTTWAMAQYQELCAEISFFFVHFPSFSFSFSFSSFFVFVFFFFFIFIFFLFLSFFFLFPFCFPTPLSGLKVEAWIRCSHDLPLKRGLRNPSVWLSMTA